MDEPRTSGQRRHGERRRLWDRRSPDPRREVTERRLKDRRRTSLEGRAERRAGADRRQNDRRDAVERRAPLSRRRGRRRRETPTPYTADQMTDLKDRFANPGPVGCPACGGAFSLGPSRRRGNEFARRVMCLGCGRAAVVPNCRAARVLVIDQRRDRRESMRAILASAGHEVIEAADAAVALAAYQTVPADVVFIDVAAPGRMNAPDFLRKLRRLFPDARVVAIAARPSYVGGDPLAVTAGLGAARAIRTPFSRDDVLRTIDEVRP